MKLTHCKLGKKVQKKPLESFVLEVTARAAADFGLLKRNGKICTFVVKDNKTDTLIH